MYTQFEEAPIAKFIFGNTKVAFLWLIVRLYVGKEWLTAGWQKVHSAVWVGDHAGQALTGFLNGALTKTIGQHPDVQGWYARFLEHAVLPHAALWAKVISFGEVLIGVALIIGLFTGIAAFFGLFMNFNFMLAGAVSINPILFVLSLLLFIGWKIAGYIGVDRFVLPLLGTPWKPGRAFEPGMHHN